MISTPFLFCLSACFHYNTRLETASSFKKVAVSRKQNCAVPPYQQEALLGWKKRSSLKDSGELCNENEAVILISATLCTSF